MNDNVSSVVRKIARMKNHHSEDDIRAAMRRILREGFPDKMGDVKASRAKTGKAASKKDKPLSEGTSRAVLETEESEPEKFQILSQFDRILRKGDVLKDMRSLREFGQSLDKSFDPGKSRKDAVPRLAQLLADMPIDRLTTVIESALEREKRRDNADDDYKKLANFLMSKRRQ